MKSAGHHRFRCIFVVAFFISITTSFSRSASGQLPVIELTAMSQSGGQVGSEFDLKVVAGRQRDEVDRLQFSHQGIVANLITDEPLAFTQERLPRYGAFRIAIASDVKPGRYEVRAVGRHGLSSPRSFLVSSLPSVALDAVSHEPQAPTLIARDVVYHSRSAPEQTDFYSLHLEKGDSIQVDILSQRVDSRMIGKLTIMEGPSRFLNSARGTDFADPQLTFEASHPGDYLIAVHDFLFGGGDEYFYQLCVQTKATAIDFIGSQPAIGEVPRNSLPESFTLLNQTASPAIKSEESPDPLTITPPCQLTAMFDSNGDEDIYHFDASAGDTLAIELQSQRLGQPTDGRVEIERAEPQATGDPVWQPVLSQDDSQDIGDAAVHVFTRDPVFNFQAPSAGTYRLLVRDLDSGHSLDSGDGYRMEIHRPAPDFSLLAYIATPVNDPAQSYPAGTCLFRGGTQSINVLIVRRDGWSGPVSIRVEGLPESVTCRSATIAANQNHAHLTLVANDMATPWVGPIRIVGTATIDPAAGEVQHDAIPATMVWGRDSVREFVRARLCSGLSVAVSAQDLMPISTSVGDETIVKAKAGEAVTLPIKLTRRDGGKQSCVLRPRDLPPAVTAGEITIAADKDDGQLELKVASDAAAGIYSFWLQTETKIKLKPNPESLPRAEQYRAHLAKLLDAPDQASQKEAIAAAIVLADQRVEAAKPASQEQEFNVFVASPTVTIEIVKP